MTITDQLNYINLVHGINNTRLYKIEKEFFSYTATRKEILVFTALTVNEMGKHLVEKISDEPIQVELMFGYAKGSLSKNKAKKLKQLLNQGKTDCDLESMLKWVSLLL